MKEWTTDTFSFGYLLVKGFDCMSCDEKSWRILFWLSQYIHVRKKALNHETKSNKNNNDDKDDDNNSSSDNNNNYNIYEYNKKPQQQ